MENSYFRRNTQKLLSMLLYSRNTGSGVRQGYMGHLINIANNIVNQCKKSGNLDKFLKDNLSPECLSKWDELVDNELATINKTYQILLVCSSFRILAIL